MPLVRIDLCKGKDVAYRQALGRAVHQALASVGVPPDDRFQIISEHALEDFVFDRNYLGIRRSENLVMIQITWNEGRTLEQKKTLFRSIADGLAAAPGVRQEDVLVNLVEVKKENWSFGNGVAQYAP
jgi:phenylpyruvate tautomerase PptA (4-oxalocrotonate tautomerase family)